MTTYTHADRNFDPIADHFAKKVYGSLKGKIRLAVLTQDINQIVHQLSTQLQRPLNILDVGAGLAQISLELAKKHRVTINDVSVNMLAKAQASAQALGVSPRFLVCPYQTLCKHKHEKYDLILCHALLEWLENPKAIMAFFDAFLTPTGVLSLCFYNPASLTYRNLMMGNFYQLTQPKTADNHSLTPNHPVSVEEVDNWLAQHHYQPLIRSGIRVFSDYTPIKRGGLSNPDDVINMELKYARVMPFCLMGRYLHIIAQKSQKVACICGVLPP